MIDNTCAHGNCSELAWDQCQEGQCFYHSPQNGQKISDSRKFWKEARRRVEEKTYDFAGWHFPEDSSGRGFNGLTFKDVAHFELATFGGAAMFMDVTFEKNARFSAAIFNDNAFFNDAKFKKEARFTSAQFKGPAIFENACFSGKVIFSLVSVEEFYIDPSAKPRPFRRLEQGEDLYRLAKQTAHKCGNYEMEGKCHYAERCAGLHTRLRKNWWRIWRLNQFICCWAEFIFVRLIFGYGEKPGRVLGWGLAVILIWAVICFRANGIEASVDDAGGFGNCLYFSAVTFTTLGYGDFRPAPGFRPWAAAEAGIGAALMAAFIVSLARKYMR